ncbi:Pseudouridine synthase [Candidatus Xenohaliotis californiensis]|uniref:Pseudouridine synthase n=1 Tax=Candidatus Xenohaliotis californiensis TaxID=84677 RepID=A0ABP0ERH2_9RICK|nr:Pseudouridine synthase [Candidatus Xenohaliotis californiensis]
MKKTILLNISNFEIVHKVRIDSLLSQKLAISRSKIERLIEDKNIVCNGKILLKKKYLLTPDQQYSIEVTLEEEKTTHELNKLEIPLNIKFEDEHILIIDKESNLVVHPIFGNSDNTLLNAVIDKIDASCYAENFLRPGIVHRIDKDTTGLLIIAKTNIATRELQKMFRERQIKRVYNAIVWGMPLPINGTIKMPIIRDKNNRMTMKVAKNGEGRSAVTHYQTKYVFPNRIASIIECQLETGRTHQIRVHFAAIKNNVIGDKQYGKRLILSKKLFNADQINNFPRQALHATKLTFQHPITNQNISIKSELPEDIVNLINYLQNTVKKI